MIYLDANVFVYAILSPDSEPEGPASRKLLKAVYDGKVSAATSALTWDEVVWAIWKERGEQAAIREGGKLLSLSGLLVLNTSESTVNRAQAIMKAKGLQPRDAIHAASCMENGITEIISDDPDFDKVGAIKRIGPIAFKC